MSLRKGNVYEPTNRMCLTHLPLDKMTTVVADDIFKCIFLNEAVRYLTKTSLEFVPKGLIDNNPALV